MKTAVLLLAAALASPGADTDALLRLTIPDAQFYSGIDVAQSRGTPFGRYVLTQMEPDNEDLKKFLAAAGFEAARDLMTIVGCSTAGDDARTLLIGRGKFEIPRFIEAAHKTGFDVDTYRGVQVLLHTGDGMDGAIAFPDSATVLVGDAASVRGAIDRSASGSTVSSTLAGQVAAVQASNDAWFLSTGPIAGYFTGKIEDENLKKAMEGGLLGSVESASGGMKFGADAVLVTADAKTKSDKDASNLGDVVKFIASLVQWDNGPSGKGSLAQSMKLVTEGPRLRISASIPEPVAEQLFMQQQKGAGTKEKAVGARPPGQM